MKSCFDIKSGFNWLLIVMPKQQKDVQLEIKNSHKNQYSILNRHSNYDLDLAFIKAGNEEKL